MKIPNIENAVINTSLKQNLICAVIENNCKNDCKLCICNNKLDYLQKIELNKLFNKIIKTEEV